MRRMIRISIPDIELTLRQLGVILVLVILLNLVLLKLLEVIV